jgi:hypothetical protein
MVDQKVASWRNSDWWRDLQEEVRERKEFASRYGKMRRRISTGRSRRGGLSAIGWGGCTNYPRYEGNLQVDGLN